MLVLSLLVAMAGALPADSPAVTSGAVRTLRLLDLDGDGRLDRLEVRADGALEVSLNRGHRQFQPIAQSLPAVVVADVLTKDLNGDGHVDLYLVSPGANVALVGDGLGGFVPATRELGLEDSGDGTAAELVDVDQDGVADVLLHDRSGDVLFWGTGGGAYERDELTPEVAPAGQSGIVVAGAPASSTGKSTSTAAPPRRDREVRRSVGAGAAATAPRVPVGPGSAPGGSPLSGAPSVASAPLAPVVVCADAIVDQTTSNCIQADSTPTFGRLLPLGNLFFVDPSGNVGIGTTVPAHQLETTGDAFVGGGLLVNTSVDEIHRGGTGLFGQANQYAFDGGSPGILVESGDGGESGGFFANGNIAAIWSPGDVMAGSFNSVVLAVFDEDVFGTPSEEPEFVVDDIQGVGQPTFRGGLVKAAVQVNGTGTAAISRSFNLMPGGTTPTLLDLGTGLYEIDFGVDVSQRYYMAVLGVSVFGNAVNGTIDVSPRAGNNNALFVNTGDLSGASADNDFFVLIY